MHYASCSVSYSPYMLVWGGKQACGETSRFKLCGCLACHQWRGSSLAIVPMACSINVAKHRLMSTDGWSVNLFSRCLIACSVERHSRTAFPALPRPIAHTHLPRLRAHTAPPPHAPLHHTAPTPATLPPARVTVRERPGRAACLAAHSRDRGMFMFV